MDFNIMFQSYEFQDYLGHDPKKDKYGISQFKIIDSDFEEVAVVDCLWAAIGLWIAIIETYEKRNLNVAANLVLAFLHYHKVYPDSPLMSVIDFNKGKNPKFAKYEKEVLEGLKKLNIDLYEKSNC